MPSRRPVLSWTVPQSPLTDSKGNIAFTWIKWFQGVQQTINSAFDQQGNFDGKLGVDASLVTRAATLLVMLQNISDTGVVIGPGIDFAQPYLNKDTDHINDGTGNPLAGGKIAYTAMVESGPLAGQILVFDGSHWLPHAKATTRVKQPHEWLDSYNDATGTFTQSRPDYGDLTGVPNLPASAIAAAHKWLNSYDASTGLFTETQPAFTDISGTATPAQIGTGSPAAGTYVDGGTGAWTPISGGGGGTPGGSSGQIQYNNAGAFGGFTASGDATINTSTGAVAVSKTGGVTFAASATTDTTNAANISSGTLAAARIPLLGVGFVINNGSTGTNVGPDMVAPRAGGFTKCVIGVKSSDGVTALTFKIKKNGTNVFSTDPTVTAGTGSGTVVTVTTLTSSPLPVSANDVFTIDITSGSSSWIFTAQLEP